MVYFACLFISNDKKVVPVDLTYVGFTLHLMGRLDSAIYCYHQALALQPKLAFCAEMVNRAMEDSVVFMNKDLDSNHRKQGDFIAFADAIAEPTNL